MSHAASSRASSRAKRCMVADSLWLTFSSRILVAEVTRSMRRMADWSALSPGGASWSAGPAGSRAGPGRATPGAPTATISRPESPRACTDLTLRDAVRGEHAAAQRPDFAGLDDGGDLRPHGRPERQVHKRGERL